MTQKSLDTLLSSTKQEMRRNSFREKYKKELATSRSMPYSLRMATSTTTTAHDTTITPSISTLERARRFRETDEIDDNGPNDWRRRDSDWNDHEKFDD
jgi:hypothetical protein